MQEVVPQVIVEQPKNSNFLIILLSILLFISVSIAGLFAFQTQKLVKELTVYRLQPKQTPTSETELTNPVYTEPTPNPTANWKMYTHPIYKYQFKYPQDWKSVINQNAKAETLFGPSATSVSGVGGVEVRELDIEPQNFYTLTESEVLESNLIKINGIDGYRYRYSNIMISSGFVFKNADGLIYNVYINSEDPIILKTFDQILSTFKFLD